MSDVLEHLPATDELLSLAAGVFVVTLAFAGARRLSANSETRKSPWVLIALALTGAVVVILLLPIGGEIKGQLVSLVGVLLSAAIALSSTTFLGNAMAGIMLRSLRNFRLGDFIKVGEHFGRVTERGVLHVEIQTADRDLLTLPNLSLVTQAVQVVRASGTVVSAQVSLGYEVPHASVEDALVEAAQRAGLQEPFVQVLELGDFSVLYRAAGVCSEVRSLLSVRSELRRHMLDTLHEAEIEIVSPAFVNERRLGAMAPPVLPPDATEPAVPSRALAPTATIFDKAEVASEIAARQLELDQSDERVQELDERIARSKGDEKVALEAEREAVKLESERLRALLVEMRERSTKGEEPSM